MSAGTASAPDTVPAPITILDGGMGKELRRIGAPFRQPEWSSLALWEAPDHVVAAHRNFIEAGAQVITTNNYAVVPYHHSPEWFAEHGAAMTDEAGRLARQAADDAPHAVRVAGSLPPLFGSYEPERFDADAARPIYRQIVEALAPHVDLWIAETLSTTDEMRVITEVLAAAGPSDADVWISFALPDAFDGAIALRSGETIDQISQCVKRCQTPIDAVLFNCSLPEQIGPALVELRDALAGNGLEIQLGAYANAFPIARDDDYAANEVIFERRVDLTAERYGDIVAGWVESGATLVGGCCDMYPEHIGELARRFSAAPP